jgi:hypothetical protein
VEQAEARVAVLESSIAQCDAGLAEFKNPEETKRLAEQAARDRKVLETAVAEWERLTAELEETS